MQAKWSWSVVVYLIEAERRIYASVKQWLLVHRRQAIIWRSAGILSIGPLGIKFSDILVETNTFSFTKTHLKMLSAKWRLFRLGLNVLYHMYYLIIRNSRGRDVGSRILSSAVITRSNIVIAGTEAEYQSDAESTKDTPYLDLTGESLLRIFVRKLTVI